MPIAHVVPPKTGFSYQRFSTPAQARGDSQRRQDDDADEYAAECGINLDRSLNLSDRGLSAYSAEHRLKGSLGKFIAAIQTQRVSRGDVLIVEAIDRLTREHPLDAHEMIRTILSAGVELHTVEDREVYTWSSLDNGQFPKLADKVEQARSYSRRLSRRLCKAWKQKKVETLVGKPLSRMCPAWLRVSDDGTRYDLIPERQVIVRRIFSECVSGLGRHVIARRLNEEGVPVFTREQQGIKVFAAKQTRWQPSYITKLLNNRAVLGEYQPKLRNTATNKKAIPVGEPVMLFPPVIEHDKFARAQDARLVRRGRGGRRGRQFANLLTGLTRCAICDGRMTYRAKGCRRSNLASYNVLVCDGHERGTGCVNSTYFRYEPIEQGLFDAVSAWHLLDPTMFAIDDRVAAASTALAELLDEVARKERTIDNMVQSFDDRPSRTVGTRIAELEAEIDVAKLRARHIRIEMQSHSVDGRARVAERFEALRQVAQGAESERRYEARAQLHQALAMIVEHIALDPEDRSASVAFEGYVMTCRILKDGAVTQVAFHVGGQTTFLIDGRLRSPVSTPDGVVQWQDRNRERGTRLLERLSFGLQDNSVHPA